MQIKNKVLLDTSALLALLKKEPGHEIVSNIIAISAISSVNLSELITVLSRAGVSENDIDEIITDLLPEIIPFCGDISIKTGKISKLTQGYGLSLGDRACLATAIQLGLPVYTADKIWAELDLPNVKIKLIR